MKLSKLIYLAIVFSIAFLGTTRAQVQKDTLVAFRYFQKADSLLTDRKLDSSIVYFKKALFIYEKVKAWERVARCYNGISENQLRDRKLENSFSNAQKVIEINTKYINKNTVEEAKAYDNIGRYFEQTFILDKALINYQRALEIRLDILPHDHRFIADSYNTIGLLYFHLNKFEKSVSFQEKALKIRIKVLGKYHKKTGQVYNDIGVVYHKKGEYDVAIKYYEKDADIALKGLKKDQYIAAYSYANIGQAYFQKGEARKGLEYSKKSLDILIDKFDDKNLYLTHVYGVVGIGYSQIGAYKKAETYFKKEMDNLIKTLGDSHPYLAKSYNNLGLVYSSMKQYKRALDYQNRSLTVKLNVYGEDHPEVWSSYNNIGGIYQAQKRYDEALECFQKSLMIQTKLSGEDHPNVAKQYHTIGILYLEKGGIEEALRCQKKSIKIYKKTLNAKSSRLSKSYNEIAKINFIRKEYSKSIENYEKALSSNSNHNENNTLENTEIRNILNINTFLISLNGKAKVYKNQYRKNNDISSINSAIAIYEKAEKLINYIKQINIDYEDKIVFSNVANETYQDAIEAKLMLYEALKNQNILKEAFYYAEKSKANTLKLMLSESNAQSYSGLPKDLVRIEKTIKTDRAFYQSQIIDEKSKDEVDSIKISSFENKLFDLNRKQDSLTQVLEKEYPKYHRLKYQNDIITVTDIQKNLSAKTTLLEFFSADSITYAFIITKNKLEVQELSTPNILEKTKEFREAITSKDVRKYKRVGHSLYTTLIAPIQNKIVGNELIIVPDGPLWHLNFDLLLTQNTTSNNPKALPYFLRDYAITYANSANLVFTSFKTNATNNTTPLEECLAFSFSDTTSTNVVDAKAMSMATLRGAKSDLPGTRREIQEISKIIDGQYYFGSEAIEANFKKKAGQYNILHLALHGEVDNDRPENSKLFFTKSKDTLEDNLLYAHELFALDIPAELTVLSACNTGSGKIAKGEGIMSLGTAFQYAGTKSLLLTSWEVPDQTTPEVMKYFYSNLKKGLNKGQALQQAKLEYLKTAKADLADPFYWGSFYLVGDSGAMHFNNITSWYWVFGIGILCILGYLIYRYKIRQT